MTMRRCPHCDENIDHVNYSEDLRASGTADIGNSDFRNHSQDDTDGNGGLEYFCPNCDDPIEFEELLEPYDSDEDDTDEVNGNTSTSNQPVRVQ